MWRDDQELVAGPRALGLGGNNGWYLTGPSLETIGGAKRWQAVPDQKRCRRDLVIPSIERGRSFLVHSCGDQDMCGRNAVVESCIVYYTVCTSYPCVAWFDVPRISEDISTSQASASFC